MRAVLVREHGPADSLRPVDMERPRPGDGEVLVRVRAAGVNRLDTWVRAGIPGVRFPLPLILGSDGAGEVAALGPGAAASGFREGDRVVLFPATCCERCAHCLSGDDQLCDSYQILGENRNGTMAEYVSVPASSVMPWVEGLDFAHAAAFPLTFLTAWHMLVSRVAVRPGEAVLIHAGGSGVGSAAVQIARLWGCQVIATAGTDEKCQRAADLGAHDTVNYTERSFREAVKELTGGRGVDVVFEHVGAATFKDSLRSLCKGGRLVTCGATTGGKVEINLAAIFFKGISILGSTMGSRAEMAEIVKHVAAGSLRPVVDTVLPLEQVGEAHARLEQRRVFGKIVLELTAGDG